MSRNTDSVEVGLVRPCEGLMFVGIDMPMDRVINSEISPDNMLILIGDAEEAERLSEALLLTAKVFREASHA